MSESELGDKEKIAKEERKREYILLAFELVLFKEGFPFPGINPESYARLKAETEEYPKYSTPIDELLEKFRTQGMKVVFGDDPNSGTVFILPLQSNDILMDNLFPRHLNITPDMNKILQRLIELNKAN